VVHPEYTSEFCEQQYNARLAVPDHAELFAQAAQRSAAVRARLACRIDIPYGPSPMEKLDLFPGEGRQRGLFMFIHGGYWRSRDKHEFSDIAEPFVRAGIGVAVINYALCPAVTVDEIVRQCRSAVAWLVCHGAGYGVAPRPLWIGGHSAGGHLTAMMHATHWPSFDTRVPADAIRGAIAVSGVFDLEPMQYFSINTDVRLDAPAAVRLSPVQLKPFSTAPMLLCVGGLESTEFHRQSSLLQEAWPTVPMQTVVMPGYHHINVVGSLALAHSPLGKAALDLMNT
jgi:arylformamidase